MGEMYDEYGYTLTCMKVGFMIEVILGPQVVLEWV